MQNENLPLTPRMIEAIRMLANGLTINQAAAEMSVSPRTLERHLRRARPRVGAETRTHLVAIVVAAGLISVKIPRR